MTIKFVRREDYGLPADSPAAFIGSTRGTKVHYLGGAYISRVHSLCDEKVRAVRQAHLNHPTENYSDIAYNLIACEHGYVFEGRGAHRRTGANGSYDLNTGHYAILALLGSSGFTKPPPLMLTALRDGIEWLRVFGNAGPEIKGHRDGHPTQCPGDPLYAWVRAGAPRPSGTGANVTITSADVDKIFAQDDTVPNGDPETKDTNTHVSAGFAIYVLQVLVRQNQALLEEIKGAVTYLRDRAPVDTDPS